MKSILVNLLTMAALVLVNPAHAEESSMKHLFQSALQDGSSEGVLDDEIARLFRAATGSQEPIFVTVKKIKDYESSCGRLRVEMKQAGVKDAKGTPATDYPFFEINICPDGKPPRELVRQEEDLKRAAIKACVVKIKKGSVDKDTGSMSAVMSASGCPVKGKSNWNYTGACEALKMPEGIYTMFPIDNKGAISVKLLIPPQCIAANNTWNAVISDSRSLLLGAINVQW